MPKTTTSTCVTPSSRRDERHRLAAARGRHAQRGDQAADGHGLAARAGRQVAQRQVDLAAQLVARPRPADGSVRYRPSVSFSNASSSRARTRGRRAAGGGARGLVLAARPRSKIDALARAARRPAPSGPRRRRPRAPSSMRAATAPVESSAPHLTRLSSTRLLICWPSTRSQKSQIDVNGPPASRAAHDRAHRALAHALDRGQAEADRPSTTVKSAPELVDVGRQHLDAHLGALVDVERHLVLRLHHRGDQRRHVRGRVVRLQVRGAVGDQRVAGGVRLVERVVARCARSRPRASSATSRARRRSPRSPRGTSRAARPSARDLLADGLAQIVGLGGREAGEVLGDLHHLLLVDRRRPSVAPRIGSRRGSR